MLNNKFNDLIQNEISRRGFIKASMAGIIATNTIFNANNSLAGSMSGFKSIPENHNDTLTVPEGYEWKRLISWGDPLFEGLEPAKLQNGAPFKFTRAEQEKRFGTNNDMIALFPREYSYPWPVETKNFIMCTNHESIGRMLAVAPINGEWSATEEEKIAMYAALGCSVFELEYKNGEYKVLIPKNNINRRITPFTEMLYTGPAANHDWINKGKILVNASEAKLGNKPKNKKGILSGTFQNCAGGYTPWGTYLTSEENIDNMFFISDIESKALMTAREADGYEFDEKSMGFGNNWAIGGPEQYDLAKNPMGTSLYGWIVEIDPYNPNSTPKKHTSLGRKKAECATCVLTKSGQVAVYSGDDQANEFVYKFVTKNKFNPKDRKANFNLLESGKIYAAKFEIKDGKKQGEWLEINLKNANAGPRGLLDTPFKDEGDVLMRIREAALRIGATQMDRPEDVECPIDRGFNGTGVVFVSCTGNTTDTGINGNIANPRHETNNSPNRNYTGHIIKILEDNNDHGSTKFSWDFYLIGGDHASGEILQEIGDEVRNNSSWIDGKQSTKGDRFAMQDNICFDKAGNLWFATDGNPDTFPSNDGIYATNIDADGLTNVKRFLTVPIGAEATGPLFSFDYKTFFLSVQHPGSDNINGEKFTKTSEKPFSSFPFGGWPRCSVIYVTKKDGGIIGS